MGNVRTALLAWLQARLGDGRIILRMDDLDSARNKPGAADQILDDLHWLGLDFDGEVYYQSRRSEIYLQAFNRLLASGQVFPCVCSRRDIAGILSAPDAHKSTVRYPGTCRPDHSPPLCPGDRPVAWRFMVNDEDLDYHDQLCGKQLENLAMNPGDFVIRRKDGFFAYQFATVVDDALFGVTDVVRGADLLDSTARQIALFRALHSPVPRFWHVSLMNDRHGKKLAKRDGSDSLARLRNKGVTAESVIGELAASVGLTPTNASLTAHELLDQLTIERFSGLLALHQYTN
jgi:glutamyl-tRNA synthetase